MKVDVKVWKAIEGCDKHSCIDKDFYVYDLEHKCYFPKEDCLETSLEIMEDYFDDYKFIMDYEMAPETFDAAAFARNNIEVLRTIVYYADTAFNLHLQSQWNVLDVLGMTVTFEDVVSIDIPYKVAHELTYNGYWFSSYNVSEDGRREGEMYGAYQMRKAAEIAAKFGKFL